MTPSPARRTPAASAPLGATVPLEPGASNRGPRPSRHIALERASRAARYGVLALAAVFCLFPLVWTAFSAFKPGNTLLSEPFSFDTSQATLANFKGLFDTLPIGRGFINTAIVIVCRGGLTLVFAPMVGFGFAKYQFPGKTLLFACVLGTLMLPVLVLIIPLLLEMGQLNWVNTYQALVLPGSVDAFSVFWMRQTIHAVPDELLDAARVDGCNELRVYRSVVVPAIRPGLAALAVLTFIGIYNDFVWPLVAVNSTNHETLQVMLSSLASSANGLQAAVTGQSVWGEILAGAAIATVPVVAVFVVLQRHIITGLLTGGVKG
jgi:lactose/L-arabinose transport system permease protein